MKIIISSIKTIKKRNHDDDAYIEKDMCNVKKNENIHITYHSY